VGAVRAHHVDVSIPAARTVECDPAAAARPRRVLVAAGEMGHLRDAGAVGLHDEDLEVAGAVTLERDLSVGSGERRSRCRSLNRKCGRQEGDRPGHEDPSSPRLLL
jgi:hypothetical protein